MKLNKEQQEAVDNLKGQVLVAAGPGTGKTELLSVRAANIIEEKKIPAENILILTYTKAAARSIKDRLVKIIGLDGYNVTAETFHGFANSVILDSEEASQYLKERIQMTPLEKAKCIECIIDNFTSSIKVLRPFGRPYYYVHTISNKISELKNEGIVPESFKKSIQKIEADDVYVEKKHLPRLKELAFIYDKYEELKASGGKDIFDERGRYDYDDMILIAKEVLGKSKDLKNHYRDKYKYIMVDEFQDTNGAQLELLFLLIGTDDPNICVVGDDDQSIYRFQGASIANFRIFKKKFPKTKIISLRDNYRSTSEILTLAGKIIKRIPEKERLDSEKELIPKKDYHNKNIELMEFSTEEEEILYILKRIKEIKKEIESSPDMSDNEKKNPYNQIAVLVRKRASMLNLIDGFLRAGIPYATDGKEDIAYQKRVRQMIRVLELAKPNITDPQEKDLLLFEVLSCDFLKIPQGDILKFINYANKKRRKESSTIFSEFTEAFPVEDLDKKSTEIQTKKLLSLKGLNLQKPHAMHLASWAVQRLVKDANTRPVHDILMGFVEDVGLYKFVIRESGKNVVLVTRELRALTSFINTVKESSLSSPDLSLLDFLEELDTKRNHGFSVDGKLVTATQNGVRIITAHGSKGLEFHTCFIPFCLEKRNWPFKPQADRIPIPPGIVQTKEKVKTKLELSGLELFDETRLFYVAASRAKSNLILTVSPSDKTQPSSFFNVIERGLKKNTESELDVMGDFLKKEKTEDSFKNTNDILKDLVKNLVLTPTKINNFLKCKRKFLYDNLLLLPGKKTESLTFGSCAHKALEDIYGTYKKSGKFPNFEFFKKSFLKELKFQGVNKTVKNSCEAKLDALKTWFKRASEDPVMPIALEKKIFITLEGGIAFNGMYDKVEFEDKKNNQIRVIDYKTGKPDDHFKRFQNNTELASEECDDYLRQLVAYKMLYEKDPTESKGHTVSHGVLVFLEPARVTSRKYSLTKGEYKDKKIYITDAMVDEFECLIQEVWKKINSLEFDKLPERDPKKCTYCAFNAICWE